MTVRSCCQAVHGGSVTRRLRSLQPNPRLHGWPMSKIEAILRLIWSRNASRRHLSKQQLTMIAAYMHPEPKKGGRGKNA